MGDGRAEESSATGDGGQAAISLTPDVDGTHVPIFESSQVEGSYVGDLLYRTRKKSLTMNEASGLRCQAHASLPRAQSHPLGGGDGALKGPRLRVGG